MVAELLDFEYGDIEYLCDAEIDTRSVRGLRPYFEKVTLQKTIKTNEPEDSHRETQEKRRATLSRKQFDPGCWR
jgi:hypothetical protein